MTERYAIRARDCARMFGVSLRTWRNWAEQKLIPKPRRIGGAVLWDRAELERWFADGAKAAEPTDDTTEGQ